MIVISDCQQIFGALLSALLDDCGCEAVWAGPEVQPAIAEAERRGADACLVGVDRRSFSVLGGLPADRTTPLIVMLPKGEHSMIAPAWRLPVSGLVVRDDTAQDILSVVREAVMRRRCRIPRVAVSPRVTSLMHRAPGPDVDTLLTARELQILDLLAGGATTFDLALQLDIRVSTVRTHIGSILQKLRVHSRVEAVMVGRRLGLLSGGLRAMSTACPVS